MTPPASSMDARIANRRREVAAHLRRRRRRRIGVVVGALAVLGTVVGLAFTPAFAAQDVRVAGVTAERAVEVERAAAVEPGTPLVRVDTAAVERQVEALAWVRRADAHRSPPSAVAVVVAARVPVLTVRAADQAWQLDEEGVVVASGVVDGAPELDAPSAVIPAVGETVRDRTVLSGLQVHLGASEGMRALVDRYEVHGPRDVRGHLLLPDGHPEGLWVRFGDAERMGRKSEVAELLLEQTRAQGVARRGAGPEAIAEVDVRAPDNPVLLPRPDHVVPPPADD